MFRNCKLLALLMIVVVFVNSCTTTQVRIVSNVPDAEVFIDDNYVGSLSDSSIVLELQNKATTTLRLEKDGYETAYRTLQIEAKVDNIILAIFLGLIPLIWVVGPSPIQNVPMQKL